MSKRNSRAQVQVQIDEPVAQNVVDVVEPVVEPTTTEPVVNEVVGNVNMTSSELIKKYGNKSNAIRALSAQGLKCGPISKALGIRYQHARNVLCQPLKRLIKEERDAVKVNEQVAEPEVE